VTHRLTAVPIGSPEALTTYVCPTDTGLGLMLQGGSFFAGLPANAAVAITAVNAKDTRTTLLSLLNMILLSVRLRRGRGDAFESLLLKVVNQWRFVDHGKSNLLRNAGVTPTPNVDYSASIGGIRRICIARIGEPPSMQGRES